MSNPAPRLIVFDCDSTLSAIEGVDELARVRGPEVFAQVEAMTHDAMDGRLAVEAVFGRRLEIIQPSAADVAAVGQRYIETVEPTALATLQALRAKGWTPLILSGGFRPAIRPLADFLEIDRVEAVDLYFDAAGEYTGYATDYPTTRSGGKPEVIRQLKTALAPARIVMVGDGVSDLETKPEVDMFVGYGAYVARDKVKAGADHFITRLVDLVALLD
ncbi:HAD-IB family phosphatase [Synoicihabitans lomoniglobus]|uniref:phosphoserine phosphatase n=1 Tax=Synoicihabitans lomoniglobus TaxID=2909285 RepID=A0AAF0CSS2_9BACT|nr:HAD-IB family phosphatase [Opitutaceae bacterium LMO-M01]WED67463.1 HAD-IB family phosphatase [Opitutaceae bacterium LMO-M01]